ncbi:putative transferase CAF17 homolog, mitochondrial [Lucilia sericata]|uniref:putative transferase CAF17 homolog, mitochondrial n=1 Tax=Lucilia sericata TaxID=13632 RepID=UPI0018A8599F|nr:putative transferase CAF17 homolog, mitochondrial [Lucilia sericata]
MNIMRNLNRLQQISPKWLSHRCIQTSTTVNTKEKLILEPLTERQLIQVKGDEVVPFLQGLITNDIKHLHPSSNKAIYAMFLNKAGRVMYDTILYSTSEPTRILIDCDKNVANELQRHLRLYRVRRKIDIDSMAEEYKVWQAFDCNEQTQNFAAALNPEGINDLTFSTDPRLKQLGLRLLTTSDKTFSDLSQLFKREVTAASEDNNFRTHRYTLGVAEGVIDMPPGKCFPLEANCDILNGVSFHKGCYIGQELTARVHHTGMIRKRHMPVKLTAPLPADASTATVHNESGANCGTIYGSTAGRALGLLRVENVLKAKELLVNGSACSTEKPQWWPQELHSNVAKDIRKDI